MLRELQQQFLQDLFSGQTAPPTVGYLSTANRRAPADQFDTYRESVIAGMIDALAETYPVCKRLVGKQFFTAMATRFVLQHRSYSSDLNAYGRELADFIDAFPPADPLPYLGDVARLEWAWQSVLDGATPPAGNLHELDALAEDYAEKIRFKLHGNSILLSSAYPVHRIWQANQKDSGIDEVRLDEGGVMLLIWRAGAETSMDALGEEQWRFLSLLQEQMTFGEVCSEMELLLTGIDLGELLGHTIEQGWVTGFELATQAAGPG